MEYWIRRLENGVAKEPICMTHGHEQWCGDCLREWAVVDGGGQRGKKWDNCNSIIGENADNCN